MPNPEVEIRTPITQYTKGKVEELVKGYCAVRKLHHEGSTAFYPGELTGVIDAYKIILPILGQGTSEDDNLLEVKPVRQITEADIKALADRFALYKFKLGNLANKPVKDMTSSELRLRTGVRLLGLHLRDLGQGHLFRGFDLEASSQS